MKRTLRNILLSFVVIFSLFISCQSNQDKTILTEKVIEEVKTLNPEEQEIIAIVEKFLMVAGNYDLQAMDFLILDKANLGISIVRDGIWKNSVSTIGEYFERVNHSELQPYYEPVNEYKILINKGQIAFVWADATLYRYGVPRTNNINNFTLIKEDGEWKFINLSFTNTRLPEELKKFDLEVFARSYAQVWCSQRPNFVSYFFSEDGVLQINDGSSAEGTEAIANVAKGFMEAFPDMVVSMDSVIIEGVTNKPFYEVMRELLRYDELDFTDTWFPTLEEKGENTKTLIHQYWGAKGWDTYNMDNSWDLYGGGGTATTTKEIARFYYNLFTGKIIEDPNILNLILTEINTKDGSGANYFLGVSEGNVRGYKSYGHGGFWGTNVLYFPEIKTSIAVFVSERDYSALRQEIPYRIIGILNK